MNRLHTATEAATTRTRPDRSAILASGISQGGINRREGKATHQTQLGIGQVKLGLDRDPQDRQQLAVEKIEHVGEQQQPDERPSGLATPFAGPHLPRQNL